MKFNSETKQIETSRKHWLFSVMLSSQLSLRLF
jgi:hypothetical protein